MSEDFRQPFLKAAATAWAGDAGADPSRAFGEEARPWGAGWRFSLYRGAPLPQWPLERCYPLSSSSETGEPQLLRLCLAVAFSFDRWAPSKVGLLHLSFKNEFL